MPDVELPADDVWILSDRVGFRAIDGSEGCLLDYDDKQFFVTNATGVCLLERLRRGASLHTLQGALAAAFDVDAEQCDRDVRAFVTELLSRGFLIRSPRDG